MADNNNFIQRINDITKSTDSAINKLSQLSTLAGQDLDSAAAQELANAFTAITDEIKKAKGEQTLLGKNADELNRKYGNIVGTVAKWASQFDGLNHKLKDLSKAASSFQSGDLGKFIMQMGAGIPVVGAFTNVIGIAVQATIHAKDAQVALNKAILDGQGALGRAGDAMQINTTTVSKMNVELTKFGQGVGVGKDEMTSLVGKAGQLGFTLEEMGIDEQTKHVKSMSESLASGSDDFGILSSSINLARITGQDFGTVMEQMRFQMKFLGDSSRDTVETIAAVSVASRTAGVSVDIMQPAIRRLQDQFKYLGFDSKKTVLQMGDMARAAKEAGMGAGAGVELFGAAVGGLGKSDFGMRTFMAQQMGMGGGLSAGFKLRQKMTEGGGTEAVMGSMKAIQNLFGGKYISEQEAGSNESSAAMRRAQEQMVMQTYGVGEEEARGIYEMSEKLKVLNDTGRGDTAEAKKIRKALDDATQTESEWRKKTLSVQERMANWLSVIKTILAQAVMTFTKAFFKGFAGDELNEKLSDFEKALGQKEDEYGNIDFAAIEEAAMGLTNSLEGPVLEFAENLGQWSSSIAKWWKEIAIGLGTFKLAGLLGVGKSLTDIGGAAGGSATALKSLGSQAAVAGAALAGWAIGTWINETLGITEAIKNFRSATEEATLAQNKETEQRLIKMQELQKITGLTNEQALEAGIGVETTDTAGSIPMARTISEQVGRSEAELEHSEEAVKGKLQTSLGIFRTKNVSMDNVMDLVKKGDLPGISKMIELEMERQTRYHKAFGGSGKGENTWDIGAMSLENKQLLLQDILKTATSLVGIDAAKKKSKSPAQDTWDISKAGWLYASQGDVVVDARSLGQAMSSGERGDSIGAIMSEVSKAQDPTSQSVATQNVQSSQEHTVKINLDIAEEKLKLFIDKQIRINIANNRLIAGKGIGTSSTGDDKGL